MQLGNIVIHEAHVGPPQIDQSCEDGERSFIEKSSRNAGTGKGLKVEVKLRCVEERGQKFHAIFQTLPRAGKRVADLTKSELAWWEGINRDASQSREPQSGERVAEDCFIDVPTSTVDHDVGCRAHQHNLSARLDRATYGRRWRARAG